MIQPGDARLVREVLGRKQRACAAGGRSPEHRISVFEVSRAARISPSSLGLYQCADDGLYPGA